MFTAATEVEFYVRPRSKELWIWTAFAITLVGGLLILNAVLNILRITGMHLFAIGGLLALVRTLTHPTYLRVLPGRLEVIHHTAWSRRPYAVERFDLRKPVITVDLHRCFVRIDVGPKPFEFGILFMRERRRFIHLLFLAAMSSYDPPPMPDDRLTG